MNGTTQGWTYGYRNRQIDMSWSNQPDSSHFGNAEQESELAIDNRPTHEYRMRVGSLRVLFTLKAI